MEIIKERLFREYGMSVLVTNPTVKYQVELTNGESIFLTSPSDLPEPTRIKRIKEPYVIAYISIPKEYIGKITDLMEKYRATYISLEYLSSEQTSLTYELPLSEIIQDFYDAIKTLTHGYGAVDYEISEYKENHLVKVDILLNGVIASPFSFITDNSQAYRKGKKLVEKLKDNIDPHLFEITIQAAINNKVISRENIKALRKNVTAKCYGGDITRKKKLWEQQKKGKKKMKQIGKVIYLQIYLRRYLRIKINSMSKALSQEQERLLEKFFDKDIPLKERVSRLVSSLGEINPNPDLSIVLEKIESERYVLNNAYKDISGEIKEKLYAILTEMNTLKCEAVQIDIKLLREENRKNKFCSIYSKLPPLIEHKNDEDYKLFMQSYERGTELSQEIAKLNFNALDLVDIQKVLDSAFATEMIEIEYLISRLKDMIKTFKSIKTPQLLESYKSNKFNSLRDLQRLIESKNREFDEFKKDLEEVRTIRKFPGGRDEKLSTGISKDLFADKE